MATESVETVPSSGDSLEEKASFPTAGTLRPPSMRVRGASRPSVEAAAIHERTLMDSLTSPDGPLEFAAAGEAQRRGRRGDGGGRMPLRGLDGARL